MYSSIESVNILTSLLLKRGVKHIVVCPGSRNAPLVHNFNECPDFICHPVTDERSAGFVALGLAQHSDVPVAVCVTSGSAILNLTPAVAEAAYQHYPLIVISADRPSCDIDRLQGQTIHQQNALAPYTSVSVSLPDSLENIGHPGHIEHVEAIINKALLALYDPEGRSVHINIPLPNTGLYDFTVPVLPDVSLIEYTKELSSLTPTIEQAKRIVLVLAQLHLFDAAEFHELFSRVSLLSEPLAAENLPYTVTDAHLTKLNNYNAEEISPDLVIYIGGNTISKTLRQTLVRISSECPVLMINPALTLEDVTTHATHLVQSDAVSFLKYLSSVVKTDHRHPLYSFDSVVSSNNLSPIADKIVSAFESMVDSEKDIVYYANSTAIRLAAIHARHYVFCNRGINGIEGSLSTAVGAALAEPDKTVYCVIGDLSFFYDQNALWISSALNNLRILLLNSGGGNIFNSLPGATSSPAFPMIAGHHNTTAEHLCKQYNINYITYSDNSSLQQFMTSNSLTIIECNICGQ